ncbi:RNA dependent RNA polymerase-domain-containing protein [Lyophyllum atratum]|nr:RNA dependent RNA polymerase-domain-containing protein [Lyophyllum atratum]
MDLNILYLPYEVNDWTVTRRVATILHSEEFAPRRRDENAVDRLINFRVKLNPSKAGGVGNDGTGVLTLPTSEVGMKFLRWVQDRPLRFEGKKIKFYRRGHSSHPGLALTLDKTPYINPDIEEERQKKLWDLRDQFRVDAVQFGVFYRPKYPLIPEERLTNRAFSIEWERTYTTDSMGWLAFEYDHKVIRISLGNEMMDKFGSSIAINFASIQKIAVGYDGNPYICFDTLTPPILEEIEFHRALTGDKGKDDRKFKRRIGSLHPGHQVVAPYAQHLRILIYNDPKVDMVTKFTEMCKIAGLAGNMIIRCEGPNKVEADRQGFFTAKRLYHLGLELKRLPWPVAFQLESLLHNYLLHTGDISALLSPVRDMCESRGARYAADLLRHYHEKLEVRSIRESPFNCFARLHRDFTFSDSTLPPGNFFCSHITFTPTRMILEGPYATQSNRVIRMYSDYLDHFVRVDFRDEDRLQYRWDREVDGSTYLHERVGGILKNGFELAGRYFEFLAYSSSALREHAVWFMNPFHHKENGWIDSAYIRRTLGDFEETDLLKCPSKYAARLAQAFTATDPSVKIDRNKWEEVPDLGSEPYLFTDGVGTIAKALGDMIWASLCAGRGDHGGNSVQPSAYQIRFLGYKGVVGVDEQLDKHPDGILMRLRKSMRKFDVSKAETADIEIAQSFEHPNTCYLNRPLVMILEDLGVKMDAFISLQDLAVAEARTINDSSSQFRIILDNHSLGRPFRLSYLLKRIEELGIELHPQGRKPGYDNPFLRQVRQVSMVDVLRDIKHSARIPVPESYLLVGVADEGPAYKAAGVENVYTLPVGHIFACIQTSANSEPVWLEGSCSISRSPVVHPGDVQRVRAIGKPPAGMLCLFGHMKNVVVLPSVGTRSLASQLGGGDVDGDQFSIICYGPLLPSETEEAASYESVGTYTLDRYSTVEDICDFVVEYIKSDVLGLLSDRLLVIADQSKDGIRDENCIWLAQLCSQAVDYPKQGIPVDIDNDRLPRTLIRCKPDWHAAEVVSPRHTDYYESDRALGVLFRSITLDDPEPMSMNPKPDPQLLTDPISLLLKDTLERYLCPDSAPRSQEISMMFRSYVDELHYICATHTISNTPGVRLLEAEVVAGTILAKCSQKRWRKDRMYRMRLHAQTLAREVQRELIDDVGNAPDEVLVFGLGKAWEAWAYSQSQNYAFGACSFGLIALGVIFDCLDKLAGVKVDATDSYSLEVVSE